MVISMLNLCNKNYFMIIANQCTDHTAINFSSLFEMCIILDKNVKSNQCVSRLHDLVQIVKWSISWTNFKDPPKNHMTEQLE